VNASKEHPGPWLRSLSAGIRGEGQWDFAIGKKAVVLEIAHWRAKFALKICNWVLGLLVAL